MNALHLKTTLLLILGLMVGTVILHELHLTPWPAFLGVIFYFLSGFDNKQIRPILQSGCVGLLSGYIFSFALPALIASFGPSIGYYILIFVSLFIVLGLGPVAHDYFNPMTFAYGLLALLYVDVAGSQSHIWALTHLIGGSFIIGCLYLVNYKLIPKLTS